MVDTVGFDDGDSKQVARRSSANRVGNGPYSKRIARGLINGRSPNGRYVAHMRHDLTEHVRRTSGCEPSFPQTVLIEQTCVIGLRLALAAEQWIDGDKVLTTNDNNQLIAWHNAFRRNLVALGLDPTVAPAQQLDAHSYAAAVPDEVFFARQREAP